jgi:hypothetical protein
MGSADMPLLPRCLSLLCRFLLLLPFASSKSSEYDKATQDMAREWVNEQHPHLGAGETWDRLHAEACAHLNLVHNARWKP